ncbi:hypothetical protein CBF77_04250 [Lactobacillus taiwanensis]|nr:hypothetical protein CBF77_04250 [Lactobacillus taiwanensis]
MNLKFWTYLLIYLFSSILNLVFFFKVLRLPLRKRHFLVLIFLILINILASGFNYLAIVFSELITIVFLWLIFKKKISSYSILGAILFVFNVEVVGDICRAILLDVTVKVIKDIKLIMLANIVLMIVPLAIIVFIMQRFNNRLNKEFVGSNGRILSWLIFYIYVVNIAIAIIYTTTNNIPPVYFFFGSVLLFQTLFAIGIYYLMQKNQKVALKKSKNEELEREQKKLEDYAHYLEKNEDELRAFRHDYLNMFNSLKISAEEGDTKELITQLDEYTKTNLNADAFKKYKDVNHVHVKSLKSIIISKLTEMYDLKIPYNFECSEIMTDIPSGINEMDLIRIIGITCDNAIEESKELINDKKEAQIEIMIYSIDGEFEYEIRNRKRHVSISTKKIQQKGYSTKKEHSGLGLTIIRRITENYENMSITYDIDNNYFDFYLVIDKEV